MAQGSVEGQASRNDERYLYLTCLRSTRMAKQFEEVNGAAICQFLRRLITFYQCRELLSEAK